MVSLGFMIDRDVAPEAVPGVAMAAEQCGFDEIWVVEDCFWAGGFAQAATVLAATSRVHVGLGIAPAPVRNPALLAMEAAVLTRLYPGRLTLGIGHGVQDWMDQVGERVTSPLTLLDEVTEVTDRLLHGERVTFDGRYVHIRDVALVFPPHDVPPIALGVRQPRSLALAGRIADGVILAEGTTAAMLPEIRAHINEGRRTRTRERTAEARITVFVNAFIHDDPAVVVETVTAVMRKRSLDTVDDLVAGSLAQARATIDRLVAAGADSVVLRPVRDLSDPSALAALLSFPDVT